VLTYHPSLTSKIVRLQIVLRDYIAKVTFLRRYVGLHLCYFDSRHIAIQLKDIICVCNKGRDTVRRQESHTRFSLPCKIRAVHKRGQYSFTIRTRAARSAFTSRICTTRRRPIPFKTEYSNQTSARR